MIGYASRRGRHGPARPRPVASAGGLGLAGSVLTATLVIGACSAPQGTTESRIDPTDLATARAELASMPAPDATGSAFASDDDRGLVVAFHHAASGLADPSVTWDGESCGRVVDALAGAADPGALLAAIGRVRDPYAQTLLWNERRVVGAFVSGCAAGRPARAGALREVRAGLALVEVRLRDAGVAS